MTDLQDLFDTVEHLPNDDKLKLLNHLHQLMQPPQPLPQGKRILDLHKGAIIVADDFDDELDFS